MVERVQVDVREELRGLVAQGQASFAIVRSEQSIAGKVADDFVLGIGRGDNLFGQHERGLVLQDAPDGLDDLSQGTVDDAVAERGGGEFGTPAAGTFHRWGREAGRVIAPLFHEESFRA